MTEFIRFAADIAIAVALSCLSGSGMVKTFELKPEIFSMNSSCCFQSYSSYFLQVQDEGRRLEENHSCFCSNRNDFAKNWTSRRRLDATEPNLLLIFGTVVCPKAIRGSRLQLLKSRPLQLIARRKGGQEW